MTLDRRRFMSGAAGALALTALTGRAAAAETSLTQVVGGKAFGTYWRAVLPADADARAVAALVGGLVDAVDRSMSPFRADSEITRFNLRRGAGTMEASADFCTVAGESRRVAALSGGAFEPTIGPLVHRYGFGPISGGLGTYAGIELGDGRIGKAEGGLTLDFCGVAKGYALDRIVASLAAAGIADVFVELGGEVKAIGRHPAGRPWRVGVEAPGHSALVLQRRVRINGQALATSGTTANGIELGGHAYSHIIDPRTGAPVDNGIRSVTVLAPSAMEADALATALLVMGPEEGGALAQRLARPALFIHADGAETMAAGFAAHLDEGEPA